MSFLLEQIVEFLIQTVGNYAVDSWLQSSSVDKAVSDLRLALKHARFLIERSECWRLPLNGPIDKLLPQLKEAAYEAEIVVDEFVYQGLKNEFEKPSSGTIFLRNWMNDFPSAVKKAFDELDKISKEMKEICDSFNIPENPKEFSKVARPPTSTYPKTTDGSSLESMCGREKELSKILNLMGVPESGQSSDGTNHKRNFSVLSIVGIGGVGKTTLAQMVCNDKRIRSYFDPIMWVCVSDNFDLLQLTKQIMESATKKGCKLTNLNVLQEKLEEKLNSKRFLLVLDDVWSKDWLDLLGPMRRAREGSIVMVTTRSLQCVELFGTGYSSRGIEHLEGLEEEIYWDFFKRQAFRSEPISNVDPMLVDIGKEICKRLKGSPLAAKTIGRLLSTSMDERHWMGIKDSAMWQLRQEESDIFPVLQLSYQYLPSHLKKCFSYCALYPKDFKFTKWELTKLWIMQGFINLPEQFKVYCGEPYIKEATDNFHELVQRCFFQKAANSSKDEYVIHDLMHDVCQSLTKDECFCLENGDWEKSINDRNVRHLSIFSKIEVNELELERLCEYKKLLSVTLGPPIGWITFFGVIDTCCKTLTSIRSLSLLRSRFKKLPESIGNLKHLQYLDISFTMIEMLPESFFELYNLVFLNMEGCSEIKSFPEGFSRLVNLRFLYWPAQRLILISHLENYAREIETEKTYIHIGPEEKIENLKYMNKVGGVVNVYKVENIPNKKAAEEAHLKNKPLINELNLHWSEDRVRKDERHDEGVLEGLWPHPNLKALGIYRYGGRTLPSWFQKEFWSYLTHICIRGSKLLTNLQDCLNPNQFPVLQIIEIIDCQNLMSLPVESFGGFASLKKLEINNCPKLIPCSNAMVLPPSIERLWLDSCGGLEKLISSCLRNLTSLVELRIRRCQGLISLPAEATSNLKSLQSLSVMECAEFRWLEDLAKTSGQHVNGEMTPGGCKQLANLQDGLNPNQFSMLESIEISDCENLVSLPVESFRGFVSLRELIISNCPKLITRSNAMVLPPSIERLWLDLCGGLEKLIPSCLRNLTSLVNLTIIRCLGLVSIPAEATSNLKSLQSLSVMKCAELQSLGGLTFLASVQNLLIQSCPKLAETGGQNIHGKLRRPEMLTALPSTSDDSERSVKRARNSAII